MTCRVGSRYRSHRGVSDSPGRAHLAEKNASSLPHRALPSKKGSSKSEPRSATLNRVFFPIREPFVDQKILPNKMPRRVAGATHRTRRPSSFRFLPSTPHPPGSNGILSTKFLSQIARRGAHAGFHGAVPFGAKRSWVGLRTGGGSVSAVSR